MIDPNRRDWRAGTERVEPYCPAEWLAASRMTDPRTSVSWRVNGEIAVLLGWGCAILLQLAHPKVAAGVAEHSHFRDGGRGGSRRLQRTIESMLALTFGSTDEAIAAARRIDAIHGYVNGSLREARGGHRIGAAYSARDPALLRWVHVTSIDSFIRTYELFVAPLGEADKDRFCAEGTAVGPLLGVPEGYLPATYAETLDYLEMMLDSGEIEVGNAARDLAARLLAPTLPLVGGPLAKALRLPIVGLLPEPIRSAYGLPWDHRREATLFAAARVSRFLHPRLPERAHRWPIAVRASRRAARQHE